METDPPRTPEYAGFWRRFNAYGIDATVVLLISSLIGWLFGIGTHESAEQLSGLDLESMLAIAQGGLIDPALVNKLQHSAVASVTGGSFLALTDERLFMGVSALYNILFVASAWGATPGKRWFGLRVVKGDGGPLSKRDAAVRHVASGVSMTVLGLGFVSIFYTRQKLAWHDAICDTRVIHMT